MVSDFKNFTYKGCKIAAPIKVCFLAIFASQAGFFGIGATLRIGQKMLCLPYAGLYFLTAKKFVNKNWDPPAIFFLDLLQKKCFRQNY